MLPLKISRRQMLETDCKFIPCGESNIDLRLKDFLSGNNLFSGCTFFNLAGVCMRISFISLIIFVRYRCPIGASVKKNSIYCRCEKNSTVIYQMSFFPKCKKLHCYISIHFSNAH
jgi:hypothetical protein